MRAVETRAAAGGWETGKGAFIRARVGVGGEKVGSRIPRFCAWGGVSDVK